MGQQQSTGAEKHYDGKEGMSKQREELDSALEALQNEMRQTISKLDPKEMVWIHQPPGMPPILCKEPVVGAVPVCATPPARKPLTDEEIKNALMVDPAPIYRLMTTGCITGAELNEIMKRVARAIERAHGIGND